jgi:acylphosphatase
VSAARKLVIRGRVQGVGYRDAMIDAARGEGVAGFVRNVQDGSVLAHLQGDDEAVARVIAWASQGPPLARVDEVLVEAIDPDPAHTSFRRG